jgi:alcohol dehydrogenase (NADP+)
VYEPLTHYNAGSEHVKHVGIVGGGGLGHMGIKIAKALGCEVTAITTSPSKVEHLQGLGAKTVVVSTDEDAMKKASKVCCSSFQLCWCQVLCAHYVAVVFVV